MTAVRPQGKTSITKVLTNGCSICSLFHHHLQDKSDERERVTYFFWSEITSAWKCQKALQASPAISRRGPYDSWWLWLLDFAVSWVLDARDVCFPWNRRVLFSCVSLQIDFPTDTPFFFSVFLQLEKGQFWFKTRRPTGPWMLWINPS